MTELTRSLYELVVDTSTRIPSDAIGALNAGFEREEPGTQSGIAAATIRQNIAMAREAVLPICQDTGMPTFHINAPVGYDVLALEDAIREAIVQATADGKLRPNSVDSITGKNSGNNLGPGTPVIHVHPWRESFVEVRLLLKGGGCENKNAQYALPSTLEGLGRADRDLEGVKKAIMHALWQAQGQGCSSGIIGVCIGGDRASGYDFAKQQLFRRLDDTNPDPELAELEAWVLEEANQMHVGMMGFGGNATLMACKIGKLNRLPASFFVSVAYNCWAFRRQGIRLDPATGQITDWLYRDSDEPELIEIATAKAGGARVVELTPPVSEAQIRDLKVGDVVVINGLMHTGRDALHHYLLHNPCPIDMRDQVLYHCGPVMVQENGGWTVKAAGPTTSIREEPYEADLMKKLGFRVVIGKGGMGDRTLQGLVEHGGVYLNAIGGAAQYYARCVEAVEGVDLLEELGVPEAMWHLRVKGFAAIVTMDSHGNSLHKEVRDRTFIELQEIGSQIAS
ncbi:MAG: fumarate hydratase [Candidatus Dadabacteria bacterium]|nr:MAG: fumarate hydratase [Candidatus Dadabacteria bacterium]